MSNLKKFFFSPDILFDCEMTSVDQLGIETVINKEAFQDTVVIKECPIVGRSLVAKRPLVPGDIVLIEEPLIQYNLKPLCRSNKSPYYSKRLWNSLLEYTREEEERLFGELTKSTEEDQEKDQSDNESSYSYDDYSSEEDSDEEEEPVSEDSDFCPGVPAAIVAYLDIHPPTSFSNVKKRKTYQQNDFDFFYYPNVDEEPCWLEHKTIQLVHKVCHRVVENISLYEHVGPVDLANFVLKIYSNAHTVALPRRRTTPTHTAKKGRREMYKAKFGDDVTYWGGNPEEIPSTPTIALLRWGSKFAHSCSPNMFLRFQPERNAMVFTVTRPLEEGEVLSFSYLPEDDSTVGGLICGTVFDRKAKLQKFKFFECGCERCVDWDWSRGVACKVCKQPVNYRNNDSTWTCFECGNKSNDEDVDFIGEREASVQRMIMGFLARINGSRRMSESMMQMLEPYLMDLLDPAPEKNEIAVPKHHWTYSVIHSLLATYHLSLFPQSFGKGLAAQLGMTVKGLEEALVYMEFLNDTIRLPANTKASSHGNPIAAFFASWRVLSLVIDLIMDSTENKYANVSYDRDDSDSDSDSSSENGDVEASPKTTTVEFKEDEATSVNPSQPVLIPLAEDWVAPVQKISDIVANQWIPLIEKVFKSHQSPAVEDMLIQIRSFSTRIEQVLSL